MQFPLDIIFIKKDSIVTIINNAQAPKDNQNNLTLYHPTDPADKVLEPLNPALLLKFGKIFITEDAIKDLEEVLQ